MTGWTNNPLIVVYISMCACCSSKRVRRRYARQALFKRLTLEELDRRYQKHKSRLRPEEDQAVRQVIDKFKSGWYIEIQARHWIETFYSPVSPLFALFFLFVKWSPWCMPVTYLLMCKPLCRKNNPVICVTIINLPGFLLLFLAELLALPFYVLLMLMLLVLVIPLELLVFLGGMCYYRLGRLRKCGVFVHGCKFKLIIAQGGGGNASRSVMITTYDDGGKYLLPHASFCWTIFFNPIIDIFKNLKSAEYSYGDIKGMQL